MDEDKVLLKIVQIESDLSNLRDKVDTLATKESIDKLYTKEDKLVKLLETLTTEMASTNKGIKRHEERIETLEGKVEKLELQTL